MELIDTHVHLYVEEFAEDAGEVIARAKEVGVKSFLLPAIESAYHEKMHLLKKQYPESIHLMTGLHPTYVKDNYKEELAFVHDQLRTSRTDYVAVGEIGVDLYWDKTYREQQMLAFHEQIKWSLEFELPIAIHCRNAFDEVFEVLEDYKNTALKGVFHCFSGDKEQAMKAIGYNLKLGIGGVATFKNGGLDRFLMDIPLSEIVLETDAPYLAPVPYRGKRNESSYITNVADKLGQIYDREVSEIAKITTYNAVELFNL